MGRPERVQPQHYADTGASQQVTQHKFMNDAYNRGHEGANTEDVNKDKAKREHLGDGHILRNIFGGKKKDSDKPDVKKGEDKEDKDTVKLEKEGGVESLKLPKGFTKGNVEKENNYMEFPAGQNKDTKVCYWRRNDFNATDDDTKRANEIMNKGPVPRKLSEQETMDLIHMMAPGRWAGNGNFDIKDPNRKDKNAAFRIEEVGGKRVLVGDLSFKDQDKQVHVMIANPNREKREIEILWLEGPKKDFEQNSKAVMDAFQHIKWADASPAPVNNRKK